MRGHCTSDFSDLLTPSQAVTAQTAWIQQATVLSGIAVGSSRWFASVLRVVSECTTNRNVIFVAAGLISGTVGCPQPPHQRRLHRFCPFRAWRLLFFQGSSCLERSVQSDRWGRNLFSADIECPDNNPSQLTNGPLKSPGFALNVRYLWDRPVTGITGFYLGFFQTFFRRER